MLVNIRNIAANSIPIGLPLNMAIKNAMAAGKKPSIGTACRISKIGIITLDAKAILAAVIPIIVATRNDNPNDANIL